MIVETEQCKSPRHAGSRWVVFVDENDECRDCTDARLSWALPRMAAGVTRDRDTGRFASVHHPNEVKSGL